MTRVQSRAEPDDSHNQGTSEVCSSSLHEETELPGELLPEDTHRIIFGRYHFAARLAGNKRVLEVGSGPGIGMALLSRHAQTLVGVEYSGENIRFAKRHYGNSQRIVRADAHKLPFAGETFELVLAMAMVYYLNFDQFLTEVGRILKPGGSLFFCVSNKDVPGFVPAPHTTYYYSVPELSNKLATHGMIGTFFGVFPAPGGMLRRRLRAGVKNAAKAIICWIPGGRRFWVNLRASTLGAHMELPREIEEDPDAMPEVSAIRADAIDRLHRVVYVVAQK